MTDVHAALRYRLPTSVVTGATLLAGSHDRMVAQEPGPVQAGQGRQAGCAGRAQREPRLGLRRSGTVMALCLLRLRRRREVHIILIVQ
jgi:hypothetical protein